MNEQKIGISEGLFVAAVPAVGYWIAFLYEFGYCKYFDIPYMFIDIGVLNILLAIVGTLGIGWTVYLVIGEPVFAITKSLSQPLKFIFLQFGVMFLVLVGFSVVAKLSLKEIVYASLFTVVPLFFFDFVFPIITQRKTKGYLNKITKQHEFDFACDTLTDVVTKKIGRNIFVLLFMLYIVSLCVFFIGGYKAKSKTDFMVLTGSPELVVLKSKDNHLIAAPFNRKKKAVQPSFKIIPIYGEINSFSYAKVGPLIPEGLKKE